MPSIQNRLLKPPVFLKNPAAKSCSPQNFLSKQSSSHCLVLTLLLPALRTEQPILHSDLVQLTRIHQNSRDQPLTLLKPHDQALLYYTHSLHPNDQEAISTIHCPGCLAARLRKESIGSTASGCFPEERGQWTINAEVPSACTLTGGGKVLPGQQTGPGH